MMKRSFLLLVAVVMTGSSLFAQSVEQGRKFFYYERYKSAKETLEKVLSANPNSIEAVYWLGQTLLAENDSTGAKNLYQKLLQQNGNAPLVLAGIGQIELMEGKTNDARQHFETAISLSKGKDIDVFNAVGRANIDARAGDANYAIEKLNAATQVKGFKDAETYILLGDAYRKLIDGGNAVTSYKKAFQLDNKLAAAKLKEGRVYLTQKNDDYFLPLFEEATQVDPAYTPAYYELFYHYYFKDVNKAAVYLDKYAANTDQGPELEYLRTDFTYAKGDFAGAKQKATQLISQYGDKVNARMYKMIAYASDTLGDLAGAKQAMNTYFSKVAADKVVPADYEEMANINSKTVGSETEAFSYLQKAVDADTALINKLKYINKAAALAKSKGDRNQEAGWLGIAYRLDPNPSNRDLYNYGFAHYQARNLDSAFSIFKLYQQKYPDEIYGYLWTARAMRDKDTTLELGLAAAEYQALAEQAKRIDSVKFKSQIIESFGILAGYENNVKKNKEAAIAYLQKILEIDPSNASAKQFIEVLMKPVKQPATKPKPAGNTTGNKSSQGKK